LQPEEEVKSEPVPQILLNGGKLLPHSDFLEKEFKDPVPFPHLNTLSTHMEALFGGDK